MEVGKGQCQESFSSSFQCNDLDEEDDDDGHFVIALDDSGPENDELDGGFIDLTANTGSADSSEAASKSIVSAVDTPLSNVSAQNSVESVPLSLHLECTMDEDAPRRDSPVVELSNDNDPAKDILKVPNFLVSSPEIIKRLKSTLIERVAASENQSNNSSSSFDCRNEPHGSILGTNISVPVKNTSGASKKLQFNPRDDCTCIMCSGWNPSKFIDTNSSDHQLPHKSVSQHISPDCLVDPTQQHFPFTSSSVSVCNASNPNASTVQEFLPTSNSSLNVERKKNHHHSSQSLMATSVSNVSDSNTSTSHCAVSFPSQMQTHSSDSNLLNLPTSHSSLSVEEIKNHHHSYNSVSAVHPENPADIPKPAAAIFKNQGHPIMKQNGSYFVLYPHQKTFAAHGVMLLKKMIPENSTKQGKMLSLNHAFMTIYQPNLRTLLSHSKKLDLSLAGCVRFIMSDTNVDKQSPAEILPLGNSQQHIPSARLQNINDTLIKVMHAHLQTGANATIANSSKSSNSSNKQAASKVLDMPRKSALSAMLSSDKKVTILPSDLNEPNVILVSKVSGAPQQYEISKIPPPPPLVRCPSVPVAAKNGCASTSVLPHSSSLNPAISLCITTTTASITPYDVGITSPLLSYASGTTTPLPTYVYSNSVPSFTCGSSNTKSVSQCVSYSTAPMRMKDGSPPIHERTGVEEQREILVIPVVDQNESSARQSRSVSMNKSPGFVDSTGLYTFTAPLETSPVKSPSPLKNSFLGESNANLVSHSEVFCSDSQKSVCHTSVGVAASLLSVRNFSKAAITDSALIRNYSAPNLESSRPPSLKSEDVNSQPPAVESSFPSVVKINLSSCANITYATTSTIDHTVETLKSPNYPMLPIATNSIVSDSYLQGTYSLSNSVSSPDLWTPPSTQNFPTPSFQMANAVTDPSSSSFSISRAQSLISKHLNKNSSLAVSTQPPSSISPIKALLSRDTALSSRSSYNNLSCTTNCSSTGSLVLTSTPSAVTFSTSHNEAASTASSLLSSSSSVSVSSSATMPSSSVSVNGLKLKIRLGDAKSTFEAGEAKSDKCLSHLNTLPAKRKVTIDQNEPIEKKASAKRVETAEEMFQRFQEQAMQDVYNAQFGVGNLSRSLRPSRSNISFVDKNVPIWRIDETKKKKLEETNGTSKSVDDVKNSSTHESMAKAPEIEVKSFAKTNKKRHSSGENRTESPAEDPEPDINDFPRLREDNSILMKKTIYTPNIMAGHQVFVKFNVFSNPQSGRNFLIPFFNLGGSRLQFDNEDMEYIKKAVVDVEKSEKFCARHLIYHSKEGKKASFLRKENLAQTNDLSDKSYNKCSYILEGFSREPAKKSLPVPEEWKVDKKVSIEIDTADVDSNVVIDFEDSLANAVVSKEKGSSNLHVSHNQSNVVDNHKELKTLVGGTSSCHVAGSQIHREECNKEAVKTKYLPCTVLDNVQDATGIPSNNLHYVDDIHKPTNYQSPVTNTHASLYEMGFSGKNDTFQNAKSSNFRPNILRKHSCLAKSNNSSLTQGASNSSLEITRPKSSSVSAVNYTGQLKDIFSTSSAQCTSSVPEVSYTDQLKELFSSGNLSEPFPPLRTVATLEDGNQSKDIERQFLPQDNLETSDSQNFSWAPIKKELVDKDYEQVSLPSLQSCESSSLPDSRDSPPLSSTNFRIKPEPIDEYFDSLEKSGVDSLPPKVPQTDNQISNDTPDLSASNGQPANNEDIAKGLDLVIQQRRTDVGRDDEETLSTCSDSVPSSSAISESSEISSSSCINTSDEDTDTCEDQEKDDTTLYASTQSFISSKSEPQNTCNTKITSLVESLKQRLCENKPAILPSVFTEPVILPKLKVKKKRAIKHRRKKAPFKAKEAVVDTSATGVHTPSVDHSLFTNAPVTPVSSSIPITPNNVVSGTSTTSKADATENNDDLTEFRKRFPFITSREIVNSRVGKDVDGMQDFVQQPIPCHVSDKQEQKIGPSSQIDEGHNNISENDRKPSCEHSTTSKLHSSSDLKPKDNELLIQTPCCDEDFDSESDIDVGVENVIHDNPDPDVTQTKWILSSPPLPSSGRRHLRDFTRENEFIITKNDMNMQENKLDDVKPEGSKSKFTIPIRPRARKAKGKQSSPKVTAAPSTASLLCQKLNIPVVTVVPKLKGKLTTPFQIDDKVATQDNKSDPVVSQDNVPKPINPGFKPSINAIFGVPDIPKSLDAVISKPMPSNKAVAKKSSIKNNRSHLSKQVAKKRTVGNFICPKNSKQLKTDDTVEKAANSVSKLAQDEHNSQIQTKKPVIKRGTIEKTKMVNNVKQQKIEDKIEIQTKKLGIKKGTVEKTKTVNNVKQQKIMQDKIKIQTKKLGTKKDTVEKTKTVNNVKQQKIQDKIENKLTSPIKLARRSPTINKVVKKGVVRNLKSSNAMKQQKKHGFKEKETQLVAEPNLKSIHKKRNSNSKSGAVNRKLGSLLIEVNRYRSLRKFAWRKYSNIKMKDKTYIVETGETDLIHEVVEDESLDEVPKQGDSGTSNMECFNLKPCKVALHKVEDMKWDLKEFPIKTESGTYVIQRPHENVKYDSNRTSETTKKKKKKSILQRPKKSSNKPKCAKKDIVDYYAAAIESLRKKALLLEEDERKKAQKVEAGNQLVIKQEVESHEFDENRDAISDLPQEVGEGGSEVVEQHLVSKEECSLSDKARSDNGEHKRDESLEINKIYCDTDEGSCEVISSNNRDDIDNELDSERHNPLTSNESVVNDADNSTPIESSVPSENESKALKSVTLDSHQQLESRYVIKNDHKKCVEIVVRNYEGEMIQVLAVSYQDQDDLEEMTDEDIDISPVSSGIDHRESLQENNAIGSQDNVKLLQREKHCPESISQEISSQADTTNGKCITKMMQDSVESMRFDDKKEDDSGKIEVMECDDSCNKKSLDGKEVSSDDHERISVGHDCVDSERSQTYETVLDECNINMLTEMSNGSDCNFVHKDIVLGFEDELGTDTVLSKLAAEGDDDMFLLGDGDDDAENIGLIPDEEVERLLGLDLKEGEDNSSSAKRNENKMNDGCTDSNIGKLSWRMLSDNVTNVAELDIADPKAKKYETEEQPQNALTVDTHLDDVVMGNASPEKSTVTAAKVSPSWKRILGTQALKEIKESVSNTIATSCAQKVTGNSQIQLSEKKMKPNLQTDKLKLKLCTGALSKAFKLSAEMRKTFDTSSETLNKKEDDRAMKNGSRSQAEGKSNKEDGGSLIKTEKSVIELGTKPDSLYCLSQQIPFVNDKEIPRINVPCDKNTESSSSTGSTESHILENKSMGITSPETNMKTITKPLGKNIIDLTKLKMKLTPILASAKAKSAAKDSRPIQVDIKSRIQDSAPEIKDQSQRTSTGEGIHSKDQTPPTGATDVKKKITPVLNTEKLANMLKNFKKPLNLNLSNSSKTSSSLSMTSKTHENISPCKSQIVSKQKSPTRKRMRSTQSVTGNLDKPTESKRSKLAVMDKSKSDVIETIQDSEDEKGERSCFDCLSELTPSD